MEFISYAARRLVLIVPTLLGASFLIFVLTMLIPGDPALMRLGNFATAEQLQSLRQEMGLTKPPYERYMIYLRGLLRGDLGRSWRTGNLVLDDLLARLPVSLELGFCSMLLAIAVGIPAGVQGAAHKDGLIAYGGKVYGILGVAMPIFWGGLVLVTNGGSLLQTNKHNSTCWSYYHGHTLPPSGAKACNPARNGGRYGHPRFYHGLILPGR